MSTLFLSLSSFPSKFHLPNDASVSLTTLTRASSVSAPDKRSRRRKRRPKRPDDDSSPSSSSLISPSSAAVKSLRFAFMDELMSRACNHDVVGVSDVIYDMVAAGLSPGPRSFHGLVVVHAFNSDAESAMQTFRRELSSGLRPLHKTFIALIRLFGLKGRATRGLEILAAMEMVDLGECGGRQGQGYMVVVGEARVDGGGGG